MDVGSNPLPALFAPSSICIANGMFVRRKKRGRERESLWAFNENTHIHAHTYTHAHMHTLMENRG